MPKNYFLALFTLTLIFSSLAAPVLAEDSWLESAIGGPLINANCTDSTICQDAACVNKCGLSQMFETIVNVSNILLALTGSVALLMFMYGGARWILAAGKQEWVSAGTAAMTAAVIGIAIILTSWLIVNFTIIALTGGEISGQAEIFAGFKEQGVWSNEPN